MTNPLSLTNDWGSTKLSNRFITIDDLVKKNKLEDLDFIKIDADGDDYKVIISSLEVMKISPVLGVYIEISFSGNAEEPNSFHNVDKTMRSLGFDLFDIRHITRYSTAALPLPYDHQGFSQNIYGRILQGNALYLRDPCTLRDTVWPLPLFNEKEQEFWQVAHRQCSAVSPKCPELSPDKLLKLACLFEIFDMPDHAAEILITYRNELEQLIDVDENLNILTKEATGKNITHKEYMASVTENSLLPGQHYGRSV